MATGIPGQGALTLLYDSVYQVLIYATNYATFKAKKIATDFYLETKRITLKYVSADFPQKSVNNISRTFKEEKDVPTIPQRLFQERNTFAFCFPFSENNE